MDSVEEDETINKSTFDSLICPGVDLRTKLEGLGKSVGSKRRREICLKNREISGDEVSEQRLYEKAALVHWNGQPFISDNIIPESFTSSSNCNLQRFLRLCKIRC